MRADIREGNRHRSALLPIERSTYGEKETRYSDHFLAADVAILLEKIAFSEKPLIPDVILVPSTNELFAAAELSLAFGGVKILIASQLNLEESKELTRGKSVLIFDDIADKCRHIIELKKLIPHAQVAVLVLKESQDSVHVDYHARTMGAKERIRFYWERGRLDEGYRPPVHAVVLPVRMCEDVPYILCQEVVTSESKSKVAFKLIGGAKDVTDSDLDHSISREIAEETVGLAANNLQIIGEQGYRYTKKGSFYNSGFVRCYGVIVEEDREIQSIDPEVNTLRWVTIEELTANLHPAEYGEFVGQWFSQFMSKR